jgi:hypothetical protein
MEQDVLAKILSDPTSSVIYAKLLEVLKQLGSFEVEPKQTSLHLTNGRAFVGVHPRKGALLLNIVTSEALTSDRFQRTEQISAHRWHNEIVLSSPGDIDQELAAWLAQAYALTLM